MILLLESHPRARRLLEQELADYGEVFAPDLEAAPVAELLADVLGGGRCRLLVLGDAVPGASTRALIRLLRAYLPALPVVLMHRGKEEIAPQIQRVVGVPYLEYEDRLVPAVYFLLQECKVDSEDEATARKTLAHSPLLARFATHRGAVQPVPQLQPIGVCA